jgi:hypothetical protein
MKKRILLALVLGLVIALAMGSTALADSPWSGDNNNFETIPTGPTTHYCADQGAICFEVDGSGNVTTDPTITNPVPAGTPSGFGEPFPAAGFYGKHTAQVPRP